MDAERQLAEEEILIIQDRIRALRLRGALLEDRHAPIEARKLYAESWELNTTLPPSRRIL